MKYYLRRFFAVLDMFPRCMSFLIAFILLSLGALIVLDVYINFYGSPGYSWREVFVSISFAFLLSSALPSIVVGGKNNV